MIRLIEIYFAIGFIYSFRVIFPLIREDVTVFYALAIMKSSPDTQDMIARMRRDPLYASLGFLSVAVFWPKVLWDMRGNQKGNKHDPDPAGYCCGCGLCSCQQDTKYGETCGDCRRGFHGAT